MTRDNRQILVNPHSSHEKIPAGALNLGEIGVQHNNVEDAALYIETVADSQSAGTVAKFITEKAIDNKIEDAIDVLQLEIDGINEAVGLPHEESGATPWGTASTVWDAIETVYAEMTAGTAAANTKVIANTNEDTNKHMTLSAQTDAATSSITYTIGLKDIDSSIDAAWDSAHTEIQTLSSATIERFEKVESDLQELSAATEEVIGDLNYSGVTQEGKPIINVTQTDGLVSAEAGNIDAQFVEVDSARTLDEVLEEIEEKIEANEVSSEDGSIVVTANANGTDLSVNIDGHSIVLNDNNELVADLKLTAITPSSANVREEYALVNHDGTQLGDTVKIYKDSSLYNVYLGHVDDALTSPTDPTIVPGSGDTALCFIYEKADGTYKLVAINVESFLEESEFADGLQVNNHVVSVKIDPASEEVHINSAETAAVLSVGPDGVKVDNIQAAIDYAVSELAQNVNADVTGSSTDGHVSVEVVQTNTEITDVIVNTDDIASADELDAVEEAVGLTSAGTFVADSEANYISAATSVRDESKVLDSALKAISDKLDAASVYEGTSFENFVSLNVSDEGNGATAITIDDTELKQTIDFINDDIANEIAAREEAIDNVIGTSASTSADTSIMGIKKLLDNITTTLVKGVTASTGETLLDVDKQDTPEGDLYTISSTQRLNDAVELAETSVQEVGFAAVATKDSTAYGSNAGAEIVDGTNGKKINLDLSLLKIDCGEY